MTISYTIERTQSRILLIFINNIIYICINFKSIRYYTTFILLTLKVLIKEDEDLEKADTERTEKEISQSLLSSIRESEISGAEGIVLVGDFVEVHLRQTRNGLIPSSGRVTEISTNYESVV